MHRVDFFLSAWENVNTRVLASYQDPVGNRPSHEKCISLFKQLHQIDDFRLTKSCTQSLEMAIAGLDLPPGGEVILPSYAFVSCANAINNHGNTCVFVDCEPGTMNISPDAVAAAITPNTRAIMTINYGGVGCNYEQLREIAHTNHLFLIEDNAHGFLARYKDKCLGNFGDISVISFDHMKNISCEEGGGISINNPDLISNFDKALEFGTNRKEYFEGRVSGYEWKAKGSNCFLAESLADILFLQMSAAEQIIKRLRKNWLLYDQLLAPLDQDGIIAKAHVPDECETNGHIVWLRTKSYDTRVELIKYLKANDIHPAFHYTALHLSEYGRKVGVFRGDDSNTIAASRTLLRLPQHHLLSEDQILYVVEHIHRFFGIDFKP